MIRIFTKSINLLDLDINYHHLLYLQIEKNTGHYRIITISFCRPAQLNRTFWQLWKHQREYLPFVVYFLESTFTHVFKEISLSLRRIQHTLFRISTSCQCYPNNSCLYFTALVIIWEELDYSSFNLLLSESSSALVSLMYFHGWLSLTSYHEFAETTSSLSHHFK